MVINILMAIVSITCGFFMGSAFMARYMEPVMKKYRSKAGKYDGTFKVNTSDPEKDVFTLELDCAIGSIPEKDELIFKVENVGSQEKPSL